MRFQRYGRYAYAATPRKSAAILRSQRRERERYPLFADVIAHEQRPVEEVHNQRAQRWAEHEIQDRARRAADWRRARAELRAVEPPALRAQLARWWNFHRWFPGVPSYLLTMLHMWRHGRLDLDAPNMLASTRPRPGEAHA